MSYTKNRNELKAKIISVLQDNENNLYTASDIDAKISSIEEANKRLKKSLKTKEYGVFAHASYEAIKTTLGTALGGTVISFIGIFLLGIGAITVASSIPAGILTFLFKSFKEPEDRIQAVIDTNNDTIKYLKDMKSKLKKESVDMTNSISEYDYTRETVWNNFLISQISEQIEMNRYISECCIVANESLDLFESLSPVTEGVTDRLKEAWSKAKAFFSKIWARFIERLTSFFTSNQHYLDKYKEIILKKPMKAIDEVSMPNHAVGVQRIIGCTAPLLNAQMIDKLINQLKARNGDIEGLKSDFIDGYCMHAGKKFAQENKEQVEYEEFAKKYFQGGVDITIKGSVLNLADMYEFCRDFKKIRDALQKDQKAIDASFVNAQNEVNKLVNVKESAYSVFYEIEITPTSDNGASVKSAGNGSPVTNTTTSKGTVANNVKGNTYTADGTDKKDLTQDQKDNIKAAGAKPENTDEVSNLNKIMNMYQSTVGRMFAAKLTAIEIIRKNYMKILEMHVKYYVGNEGAAPNQAQAQATDQSTVNKTNQQNNTNANNTNVNNANANNANANANNK